MAADQLAGTQLHAHGGSPATPSAQDAKAQATKIYEALDAKGYGIVKRQQVADALPDNKVGLQQKCKTCCCLRLACPAFKFAVPAVHILRDRRSANHTSPAS